MLFKIIKTLVFKLYKTIYQAQTLLTDEAEKDEELICHSILTTHKNTLMIERKKYFIIISIQIYTHLCTLLLCRQYI